MASWSDNEVMLPLCVVIRAPLSLGVFVHGCIPLAHRRQFTLRSYSGYGMCPQWRFGREGVVLLPSTGGLMGVPLGLGAVCSQILNRANMATHMDTFSYITKTIKRKHE